MKNYLIFYLLFFLPCISVGQESVLKSPNIIFETDMGNDVDDVLALALLYHYQDMGKINLLAVCSNKESQYSTEYISLLNHWYGYPNIPIGRVVNGIDSENESMNYAKVVCLMKNAKGENLFPNPNYHYGELPEAVSLYRKILSAQPDSSVTIISVGFSTNIARLLNSFPDVYSPLDGKELIARKVKLLSMMAGSFGKDPIAEYNVVKDISAAQLIAEEWPTPIVYTPHEAGMSVLYPADVIEHKFRWVKHHPLVEAYKNYLPMPYDRPTWDVIATLYAVEPSSRYFTQSSWGKVTVSNDGLTSFVSTVGAKRAYLTFTAAQTILVRDLFVKMTTKRPKCLKK